MIYNIDPKLWGKHFWNTIHYITISYPNNPTTDQKRNIKLFFELLGGLLPCENCRAHFAKNIQTYPLTDEILNSRYKLIEWAVKVHNEVNNRTGKQYVSVNEAIQMYTQDTNKQESFLQGRWNSTITMILLILLIVVLIYYVKFR